MQDRNLIDVNLTSEMKTSFIDYAMSVIVARALPDVRDGLKPVHRRILYGMNELGVTPDKPHKKSARITGDVMGKYHPHGDSSIYEAMVRMAQWWSYRHMLVDGHGNFGSMDGDGAAAQRYTEARMSKIALELLRDINKNTVNFQDNYDGSEREPVVLPARFPNLLVNGATGIAVGMATNIPPHNLAESIDAVKMVMEHPDCTTRELMEVIPGPDFPTGALVMGRSGIHRAYDTGKGSIVLRSRTEIETTQTGRERIVVTEFPYGVNKTKVHEHIVRLAQEKRLEGITAVRDESSREGVRFVIEIRREASATVILNNLFKLTSLQTNFSFNMLAIENGVPKILSLRQIIDNYISHQKEVIIRRTQFDKDKAEARAHILEGLLIALDHLDEVIAIIRNSETDVIAQTELMSRFDLSERQSQAILDMRLRRLTGLERDKIQSEYDDLLALIADLSDTLAKPERIITIIKEEMDEIKRKYANPRRTELMVGEVLSLEDEDLIEEEDVLITLSNKGYIKRLAQDEFRAQKRGGRGVQGTGVNNDDFVRELVSTSTHDTLLFFTNFGRVYRLKAYEIPEYGRTAKGLPIVNLLKLEDGETIQTIINARKEETAGKSFFFTTKQGIVKRTEVSEFNNIRQNGLRALKLKEGDQLINVLLTSGQDDIIIGTHSGYSVRFNEASIRNMGRSATGVRGVKLREDDRVVGASRIQDNQEVLVITENGFGKRTSATDYPTKGRGGKGIKTANITPKNGQLAGLVTVDGTEDIMVITNKGVIIRTNVANISQTGRATLGVKIMKLDADAKIVTFTLVQPEDSSIDEINTDRENSISKNKDN
ncbi:TPA: DNA gyrase subunit A [Streptococcus pyogenes]|uniref:DNA gyrase subunit A n=1 Tax=Streptococcus pyogenes serotype M12 (strain MGAS9429) TaxID=370551 RepID=Q1JLP0_STRPC|nr:DNA gyrase subunit A [Streptococcus pyogenes]ABF36000.1 DNA gyrase subunit A [Streptococcus pyogenes MGAS2096]ESA51146.1 DNA gyrase, A subunit [Streptococcus pyogenes GA40056]EZM57434.1 DNA gyrase subunit A [Streptococcus pyogenes ABC020046230]HEP6152301.1 DNA gyrase subunit A [Streptococcus pyogenes ABC020047615]HEP6174569.1 DNA gyrase subunit A [Streptococcus pyogenes ABC020056755]HEP6180036.1 DNA gyrase subunit A [Streptococcus pyogenes ABC020057019]HEP6183481.1 DNA gyrase subunit A [S